MTGGQQLVLIVVLAALLIAGGMFILAQVGRIEARKFIVGASWRWLSRRQSWRLPPSIRKRRSNSSPRTAARARRRETDQVRNITYMEKTS